MIELIVEWNLRKKYNSKDCNSQHFVLEIWRLLKLPNEKSLEILSSRLGSQNADKDDVLFKYTYLDSEWEIMNHNDMDELSKFVVNFFKKTLQIYKK